MSNKLDDLELPLNEFNEFLTKREMQQDSSQSSNFEVPASTKQLIARLEHIRTSGSDLVNSPNFPSLKNKAKKIIKAQQEKEKQQAEQAAALNAQDPSAIQRDLIVDDSNDSDDGDQGYMMKLADGQLMDARVVVVLADILKYNRQGGLTLESVADILVRTLPMVIIPAKDGHTALAVYDPDTRIYTSSSTTILNTALVTLFGTSSNQLLATLTMSLIGRKEKFSFQYRPLPKYKIAVGNGIYNGLTRKLEPFTPRYTILTKIETNYNPKAKQPDLGQGFSFQQMVNQLADGNRARTALLKQICKSIITGVSTSAALFIFLGKGGDGKSTFFQLLENVIGSQNTAHVNFSEINSDDKLLETMGKKLVVGLDNDTNIYIRKTAKLKSMAAHEAVTYSRKYLSAISVPFTATIVQLCNDMPRFSETGTSMRRRLVTFKAEHSYTLTGTENNDVSKYIQNKEFLEYVLKEIIDFPYVLNYNDVDRQITNDTLDEEDTIGQFIDDMDQIHLFDGVNKMIPLPHLYAAYLDWSAANQQSSRPYSTRAFSAKIIDPLFDRGYTRQTIPVRLRTIIDSGEFIPASFDEISSGKRLSEVLADTKRVSTRVFVKTGKRNVRRYEFRRHDESASPVDYFGLSSEYQAFAEYKYPDEVAKIQPHYLKETPAYNDEGQYSLTPDEAIKRSAQRVLGRMTQEKSAQDASTGDNESDQSVSSAPIQQVDDVRTIIRDGDAAAIDTWLQQARLHQSENEVTTDLDRAIKQLSKMVSDAQFQAEYVGLPKSLTDEQRQTKLIQLAKILQQKLQN